MVKYTAILSLIALSEIQLTNLIHAESTITPLGFTHSTYNKSSQNPPGVINVMALGDWGAPHDKEQLLNDQKSVATIMDSWSTKHGACHVVELGDSLYYHGVTPMNCNRRMDLSFVNVYPSLHKKGIPWSGVVGNHDIAHGTPLCLENEHDDSLTPKRVTCETPQNVIDALNDMVRAQTEYAKVNHLWHEKKNFYTETFTNHGLVVDLYYVDMNSVMSKGPDSICCQCYVGPVDWRPCQTSGRGDVACSAKPDVVKACVDLLDKWEQDSYEMVHEIACASKAHHKVLVSHYSILLHMKGDKQTRWLDVLKKCGIKLSVSGHTHSMAEHKYDDISFLTSGNGGGLGLASIDDPTVGITIWKLEEPQSFGFLALSFTEEIIKAEFVVVAADSEDGYKKKHEATVPRAGGEEPSSSKDLSNLQIS